MNMRGTETGIGTGRGTERERDIMSVPMTGIVREIEDTAGDAVAAGTRRGGRGATAGEVTLLPHSSTWLSSSGSSHEAGRGLGTHSGYMKKK